MVSDSLEVAFEVLDIEHRMVGTGPERAGAELVQDLAIEWW